MKRYQTMNKEEIQNRLNSLYFELELLNLDDNRDNILYLDKKALISDEIQILEKQLKRAS